MKQNANSEYKDDAGTALELSPRDLEIFLEELARQGRKPSSLESYRVVLEAFYAGLPEEKLLTRDTPERWRQDMERQGYAPRTIRSRLSVLNSFLRYLQRRSWQIASPSACLPLEPEDEIQPELTRTEYLRLLQTAKLLEEQGSYLLIKAMGSLGVRLQELPQLTVEQVRRGVLKLRRGKGGRVLPLPEAFQQELLEYALQEGVFSGPIFVTRDREPMNRAVVWRRINRLSQQARVSPKKANPRCLWKLYQDTWEASWTGALAVQEQSYTKLLEREQQTIGWNV